MKNILIIGAGGVGSWLSFFINNATDTNQLKDVYVTIADGDTVELKNITYQNFKASDILENKAQVLYDRYKFLRAIPDFITDMSILDKYDCVICAVDNTEFRKKFYDYVFNKNTKIYWVDLRSEGRIISYHTKHKANTYEVMINTLPDSEESASCQLKFELEKGIIQNGNKIIAAIGSQLILNWHRKEANAPSFINRF